MASDELDPSWFPVLDLPVNRMWDDERYWLPEVLDGRHLVGEFAFDEASTKVESYDIVVGSAFLN